MPAGRQHDEAAAAGNGGRPSKTNVAWPRCSAAVSLALTALLQNTSHPMLSRLQSHPRWGQLHSRSNIGEVFVITLECLGLHVGDDGSVSRGGCTVRAEEAGDGCRAPRRDEEDEDGARPRGAEADGRRRAPPVPVLAVPPPLQRVEPTFKARERKHAQGTGWGNMMQPALPRFVGEMPALLQLGALLQEQCQHCSGDLRVVESDDAHVQCHSVGAVNHLTFVCAGACRCPPQPHSARTPRSTLARRSLWHEQGARAVGRGCRAPRVVSVLTISALATLSTVAVCIPVHVSSDVSCDMCTCHVCYMLCSKDGVMYSTLYV